MIKGKDIYDVLSALVPLYVAMILAYGSVRWWKIFTPDQCSGINRFVAVFAVPLLSFHFISSNDPYSMNFRFIAADSLQKVVILLALFLWQVFSKVSNLDWMITFFSLSTLPNTLVMGIPLLKAMYGEFSATLMVQIVVLQSVIWYTIMLFMFEYRGAKALIAEQFPDTAGSITSFLVESDVLSLSGRDPLQAEAEIGEDGKLHVVVRKSSSSRSLVSSYNKTHGVNSMASITPCASNLTGVEIYSRQSSNQTDFYDMFASKMASPRHGYVGNLEEEMVRGGKSMSNEFFNGGKKREGSGANKELHMFGWSSSASPVSERYFKHAVNRAASDDFGPLDASKATVPHEIGPSRGFHESSGNASPMRRVGADREFEIEDGRWSMRAKRSPLLGQGQGGETMAGVTHQMPPASIMTRLILIMVWRKLIRNPNTYASVIGLVWSLISYRWNIEMPIIVKGSISILSDTGLGMAMFSLGLFMALQPKMIACGRSVATFSMAVRFLIGPAVIAATSVAIGIRGVLLRVAILQAALPQGIVPFVFAKEYNCHADILSTAVIFGMLAALPVAIVYYILLGL